MNQNEKTIDLLQEETLSQKLIKKGFWLYLFSYLIAPGGYLIRLLISNSPEVSVADVGILYSIISLISFLNVYNDLGLTESLQYFLPKFWIKKQYNQIKTTIWLSLGVQLFTAILIALGLWFGSDWLAANYFHNPISSDILKYFCFYFLGINLFQTLQSIFIAFQRTFDYQFVEFVRMWATVWFTFFCFLTDRGSIEWYSLNWLLGLGIGILIAGFIYYKNYHRSLMQGRFERDQPTLKKYRKYALRSFIWLNISSIFWQIIQQLVLYFLGDESAGYFSNFQSLFNIGFIIIWPIMSLIFPIVAETMEKKDEKKLELLIAFLYSYFSIFAISFSVLLMVLGPEIATVLFWEKFRLSWEISIWWTGFLVFNILSNFNFAILWWIWAVKQRVYILVSTLLLTILISSLLIHSFGLPWAALWFWIGYFFARGLSLIYLKKKVYFQLNWGFVWPNVFIIFLLGFYIWSNKHLVFVAENNRWDNLLYLIALWIWFFLVIFLWNIKKYKLLRQEIKNFKDVT